MSADLQRAGQLFGCRAMLHVVGPSGRLPPPLDGTRPWRLAQPLAGSLCRTIMPVIVGAGKRSELLDVALNNESAVTADRFPLPAATSLDPVVVPATLLRSTALDRELNRREQAGASLFGNYLQALEAEEPHGNWRSLNRLPPRAVQALKHTPLDERSRDWLIRLPKAELHCHLGGMLDLAAQRQVAEAVWSALTAAERDTAWTLTGPWIESGQWPSDWPEQLRHRAAGRSAAAASLLLHTDEPALRQNLYAATEPRVNLKVHRDGFAAYERPGELSGSALLQHEAAIEPYARAIVAMARAQGLRYLELRGSPQKYLGGHAGDALQQLHTALQREIQQDALLCRFIIILDRRQPAQAADIVRLAVRLHEQMPEFMVGLDLAGAEGTTQPEQLAQAFEPAFRACLPVTIHAGEGEPAANIWEAAYRLHADRIGHGLTLADNPQLLQRFRDRGVCIELCPSSNREVVGFRDPVIAASADCPDYPLAALLQAGLRVTLCTDNPGISRTTLADEYLCAARMIETQRRLTRWDALVLIRQAFKSAFLPASERSALMKSVDQAVFQQLLTDRGVISQ